MEKVDSNVMTQNVLLRLWWKNYFAVLTGQPNFAFLVEKLNFLVLEEKIDFEVLVGKFDFQFWQKLQFCSIAEKRDFDAKFLILQF